MLAKETIQAEAVLRRLNLARVGFTDGADSIAPRDTAFQEVDLSEELELLRIEQAPIETNGWKRLGAEDALIAKIVDGEQRLHAAKSRVAGEVLAHVNGNERGLPIVTMDDFGPEQIARDGDSRHRKHREAQVVVGKISGRRSIDSVAVE